MPYSDSILATASAAFSASAAIAYSPVPSCSLPSTSLIEAIATSCSTPALVNSPNNPSPSSWYSPSTNVPAVPSLSFINSAIVSASDSPKSNILLTSSIILNKPSGSSAFGSPNTSLTAVSAIVLIASSSTN